MPKKLDKRNNEGAIYSRVIKEAPEDETFNIGQGYDGVAATTLECALCGGKEFNVGSGNHYSVIKCPKCKWESCIHDG